MLITEISIKRPVFAIMLMVGLSVIGLFSYFRLPVAELPDIDFPLALVEVTYPGASPKVVESEVTKKVEEASNTLRAVKKITSFVYEGLSLTIVEFQLERNPDAALQDVRGAIARIRGNLPKDIDDPVVYDFNPTEEPVIVVGLSSETLSLQELSDLAEQKIKKRLEAAEGAGRIQIEGSLKRQFGLLLDPDMLQKYKLGLPALISAVKSSNLELPAGSLENNAGSGTKVRFVGRHQESTGFADIVLKDTASSSVKLSQLVTLTDASKEADSLTFLDGKPIIAMEVTKIRGANALELAGELKKIIAAINSELPQGTKLSLIKDSSESISDSLHELNFALILGIALTVGIVFLFLNSWRSTVITGLALPISLISTFGAMYFFGFSLNTMTFIALSLAVGLVIDDAIVVRENIIRHLDMGKTHYQAALDGTKEVGLAVTASTLTIVAVFLPVAFMGGITGLFFKEFGLTVSVAVLVSLLVSFTLDPMLSSIWKDTRQQENWLSGFNRGFDRLTTYYALAVTRCISRPFLTLLAVLVLCGLSLFLLPSIGVSFLPSQDKSQIDLEVKSPENSTLEYTVRKGQELGVYLDQKFPEIDFIYFRAGGGFNGLKDEGKLTLSLVPRKERKKGQEELLREMRLLLANFAGAEVNVRAGAQTGPGSAPVRLAIRGSSPRLMEEYADKLFGLVKKTPKLVDVERSDGRRNAVLKVDIDRPLAADLKVSLESIASTLRYLIFGEKVTTWRDANGEEYDVLLRLPKALRGDWGALAGVSVTAEDGQQVLLSRLVKPLLGDEPSRIERQKLLREVAITAEVQGISPGQAITVLQTKLKDFPPPAGISVSFAGEAEDIEEAASFGGLALLLGAIFVYLILASQFNSYSQPLAILFTLPLALVGVIVALYLTNDTFNLISLIGVVTLMGLVTKNGILLVEFAVQLQERGLSWEKALARAGQTRLRPIVMTSLASAIGVLPLALGLGAGSELRAPMARAIVGGIISSTILTLFVIPCVFIILLRSKVIFGRFFAWVGGLGKKKAVSFPAS